MAAFNLNHCFTAVARLTAEYRALPGLRLTTAQAARLCGLSIHEADVVLTALTASGYLSCDRSGQYALAPALAPDVAGNEEARLLETTH
jgi:DNA-binding IclR family transcriptional regulator